jgi:hypothetical protein
VDERDQPIPAGSVVVSRAEDPAGSRPIAFERGSLRFYARLLPADLEISAPGFLTQHLSGDASDRDVVMKPAWKVRVVLQGTFDTSNLRIALVPPDKVPRSGNEWIIDTQDLDESMIALIGVQSGVPWFSSVAFDRNRTALVPVGGPGEYAVCCSAAEKVPASTQLHVRMLADLRPSRFTVAEADHEPTLELQVGSYEPR